jgi:hypothetical protein
MPHLSLFFCSSLSFSSSPGTFLSGGVGIYATDTTLTGIMGEAQRQPSILGREGIFQRIMGLRLYIALEKRGLLPYLFVHAYFNHQSREDTPLWEGQPTRKAPSFTCEGCQALFSVFCFYPPSLMCPFSFSVYVCAEEQHGHPVNTVDSLNHILFTILIFTYKRRYLITCPMEQPRLTRK